MVIQCPECQTRFKMADEKAKAGTKVRCSRCKHIFPVQAPSLATSAPASPEDPVTPAENVANTPLSFRQNPSKTAEPTFESAAGKASEASAENTGSDELNLGDFNMADRATDAYPTPSAENGGEFDFDDFSIEPPPPLSPKRLQTQGILKTLNWAIPIRTGRFLTK